ncbi:MULTISPECIES: alpha/beta fold hydrolase [Chryseobacterium]|uniref:Alpha/beta hydrolase n=1 Tax=Chryseobacterium turcicum TaxID=2898076 RepID=A0A9Q3V7H9_9FLAO|nr:MULTISPECIES: alpha/beta hydrolase [Chryseobacterium]MCD1119105.1 alpha/beta hydrolase [Chryseobacterium turcicum]
MSGILKRNNVTINGSGKDVIFFAHGFGCDQNMWCYVSPAFEEKYTTVLFDHVGAGNSDLNSYSFKKYSQLEGYAEDIVEIARELNISNAVFVGHSVSAIMGIIAAKMAPDLFAKLVLVAPSPSYINDENYVGGFSRPEIDELLDSLNDNHLGWSATMAPVIMGNSDRQELGKELTNSFCKTDPDIAKHFARTTFLTDKRDILTDSDLPVLILQCRNDIIAPVEVGHFMHTQMKGSQLVIMNATGHCPNLSAPEETIEMIRVFLND